MGDHASDVEIIRCPQCGTRNRVGAYSSILRPVCGRCHASLTSIIVPCEKTPSASTQSIPVYGRRPKKRVLLKVFLALVLLIVIVWGAQVYFDYQMITPPLKSTMPENNTIALPSETPIPDSPPLKPQTNIRLPNGSIIRNELGYGKGHLKVTNGLSLDATAKLISTYDNKCKVQFYIASDNQYTLTGINDGSYLLIFCIGEDWDTVRNNFSRKKSCSKFNEPMDFDTIREALRDGIYLKSTVLEVTLHPVPNGNARSESISEAEFKKY